MYIKSLITFVVVTALVSCGNTLSDSDDFNDAEGSVTIDGTVLVDETLTATLTDSDGVDASSVTYQWRANGDNIADATDATYSLTGSEFGAVITVAARYNDGRGSLSIVVSDGTEPVGGEVAATFEDLAGLIVKNEPSVTGTVTVTDPNPGEDLIEGQMDTVTSFGTFSIMPSGAWEYMLDTANPTIVALSGDEAETDTIAIETVDGTTADLVITIDGAAILLNQVAVIRDTSGDTGELRYQLFDSDTLDDIEAGTADGLLQGSVEAVFTRRDDDFGSGDAFITLYNFDTSDDGAIFDLRIRDNNFGIRFPDTDVDTDVHVPTLDAATLSEFQSISISWDYVSGRNSAPQVTVEIDGVSITTDSFLTPDNSPFGGVTHVAFRFGDSGGVRDATATFTVDNWAVYSDTAATVEVFSDDFQSYEVGFDLLNGTDTPYNGSTFDAVVEETEEVLTDE